MKNYLIEAMELIEFPAECVESLLTEWDDIKDGNIGKVILEGHDKYVSDDNFDPKEYLEPIKNACKAEKRSYYPAHALYLISLVKQLKERYKKLGILSDDIYIDSIRDIKWKLLKTHDIDGIWGTSFGDWSGKFFRPDIFALGRLQYEIIDLGFEYSAHGFDLTKDTKIINVHIPASGPLLPELCMDSFKKAHEFFRDTFPSGISIFLTETWLIFPKHREFLPANSNILKFMDFFDIAAEYESEPGDRNEMWRVFGKYANAPVDQLPRDTSIRRAYADWLAKGGTVGGAYGIFFFDGEKIIK